MSLPSSSLRGFGGFGDIFTLILRRVLILPFGLPLTILLGGIILSRFRGRDSRPVAKS